jgi:hypothetical protein
MTNEPKTDSSATNNSQGGKPDRVGIIVGISVIGLGLLIAIAPIPLTYFYCELRGNPGGCGDGALFVFITAPTGIVMAFVGLIIGIASAAWKQPNDDIVAGAAKIVKLSSAKSAKRVVAAPSGGGRLSWKAFATIARILFVTLFIATTAVSVVNVLNYLTVAWLPPLIFIVAGLGASPIAIAAWSAFAARKVDPDSDTQPSRAALARLIRVQGLVALAGAIWTPMLLGINSFTGVMTGGWDPSEAAAPEWGPDVGISPMLMGISAYVILFVLRAVYRRGLKGS